MLSHRHSDWDESDIRVRPGRRGSRPRTKTRPIHDNAVRGVVVIVDRGRYTVLVGDGEGEQREVTAMKARELGKSSIVVGDHVGLVGDVSGNVGTLARIVKVFDRSTVLLRTADDADSFERVIVANADQMVIVTALADPPPRLGMIDRCLVAAYDADITPLLVLTKADLASASAVAAAYEPLDIAIVVTSRDRDGVVGLGPLHDALSGRVSVFVGHSGVGKSTLVNALIPELNRATGAVNTTTGRGRHTSSSAVMARMPGPAPGWIIDTPGVRSFGLAHVDPQTIINAFPDLSEEAAECPRGCLHTQDAPDCTLDTWAETVEEAGRARLVSFRRLLASRLESSE